MAVSDQDTKPAAKKAAAAPKFDQSVEKDALNLGAPMIDEVDPRDEPTGPEDALGEGPTRGDYSERIGPSNYHPHQVVAGEQREDGTYAPVVQNQRDFVEQGSTPAGKKGGVDPVE
jgi:hypothetical protein